MMRCRKLGAAVLLALAVSFFSTPRSFAQFTADFQTNTIDGVVNNWSGDYNIGNTFADALLIQNGGELVATGRGILGPSANSSNNLAVVSDTGSVWTNTGHLFVGY